eukprot:NODE_435_length_8649_cov_0.394386.p1 type:complete len:696 gc:universal NODE_435_length_8649_cov_0.394386:4449-2362(-)
MAVSYSYFCDTGRAINSCRLGPFKRRLRMLPNEKQIYTMNKHGISPSQARQLTVLNRSQSLLNSNSNKPSKVKHDEVNSMYYDARHNTLHQWALRYTLGTKQNNDTGNIKVITKKDPVALKRTKSVLRRAVTEVVKEQPKYPTTTIDLLQPDDVIDDYKIEKCIGRGSFANVYQAQMLKGQSKVALKVVLNHAFVIGLDDKLDAHVQHELLIWQHLKHPNILSLVNVLYTNEAVFLVMELMHGTLLDFIHHLNQNKQKREIHRRSSVADYQRPRSSWQIGSFSNNSEILSSSTLNRPNTSASCNPPEVITSNFIDSPESSTPSSFSNLNSLFLNTLDPVVVQQTGISESLARHLFSQLLSAINYLHSIHIVHNDLKLDNILIFKDTEIINCKITDFGLSLCIDEKHKELQSILSHVNRLIPINCSNTSTPMSSFQSQNFISSIDPQLSDYLDSIPLYSESKATGSLEYCAPEELANNLPLIDDIINRKVEIISDSATDTKLNMFSLYSNKRNKFKFVHSSSNPYRKQLDALINKYLTGVDIWALGVILYSMISGDLPFIDEFQPRLTKKILTGDFKAINVDEESLVEYELMMMRNNAIIDVDVESKIQLKGNVNSITVWADLVLQNCLSIGWYDRPSGRELVDLPWINKEICKVEIETQLLEESTLWKDFPNTKTPTDDEKQEEPIQRKKSIFDF